MATCFFRGGIALGSVWVAVFVLTAAAAGQDDDDDNVIIGNLPATTVQLPTFGISIDAEGTLDARVFRDVDRKLIAERMAAAKAAKAGDVWAGAKLRKISLVGLEAAVAAELAAGRQPDELMRNLAGLTRVRYVFCYPARDGHAGDVVIAGPVEPWVHDPAGRAVCLVCGQLVLQLQHLAVALRAFPQDLRQRPVLGCSIYPSSDGLA